MPSKSVVNRLKSLALVVASARNNEARLAASLNELWGLPPEVTRSLLQAFVARLQLAAAEVEAADHANLAELLDDDPVRAQRDAATEQTCGVLLSLRDTVTAAYGEPAAAQLGLDSRIPSDPVQVQSLGSMALKQLATWVPPGSCLLEGYTFKPETWTAKLAAPVAALTEALTAVAREKREADATLVAKNRAIEQSDRMFTLTASVLSALLEAAGESELARRVRPSRRRAGQTVEAAEETSEEKPAEPLISE
jgi:uncharacterized protein (DUF2267 family)